MPPTAGTTPKSSSPGGTTAASAVDGARLGRLPSFARSLLRVPVSVSVILAEERQTIPSILNLAPGTILQFEKSCQQPLTLTVSGVRVAEGEAVKIGEKLGLRLSRILPPPERPLSLADAITSRTGGPTKSSTAGTPSPTSVAPSDEHASAARSTNAQAASTDR